MRDRLEINVTHPNPWLNRMNLIGTNQTDKFWVGIDLHWAYTSLLTSIAQKTHCSYRAKDILHDSFLHFVLAKNPNRHQEPHAYLRTIAQNLILEHYRKDSHFKNYQHTIVHEEATIASAEYIADIKQRLELLSQVIQNLPPRCREVFILFRIEGVSQREIAAQLSISINMVERHLIRALLDIRSARQHLLGE